MNSIAASYDYIIVGAGSAGCLLANRLTEDAKTTVLLVEAGKDDRYPWVHIPVGYLYCMNNPRTDWQFKTEAEPGLNGRVLNYPRGKVLGGCSSINGMIYMRGQSEDYDHWQQLGNPGWSWKNVLPYFIKSQNHFLADDKYQGTDGELRVEKQRLSWEILDAFANACESIGIPKIDDFNRGNNAGVSYFLVNQKSGWRWSSAKAFLKPAAYRDNLTILTQAQAEKILFDGKSARGIQINQHNQRREFSVNKELILSAGAIGSPQLLMLSGIGPSHHLQSFNIPVVHHLPGVGENLQDHLQIRCSFRVSGVKTLNQQVNSWWGKLNIGLEYLIKRSGPMSMAPSQLGVFAKSDPQLSRPDLEYHVQPLSLEKFGDPLDPYPAFTASVCHLRPESRGNIQLQSDSPYIQPKIKLNYLSAERDRVVAANAIRLTRKIVAQPALSAYRPKEIKPGIEFLNNEQLAQAAGNIGTTIFHPVGTAKMGDDPMAVVDSRLRVIGIDKLRIVDASIMPTITSGNTHAPTTMIAEKAADMIRASS
ncbi:GMC family oxidoreductase N-terminal domain-containing protein [Aliikangiella sp. GXAS 311]|uniref:GMC family oxidoreductase N-terminal domain-containing protein n=3 Tax=Aliikangiella maris TaxID=3162458 RepID=A0ABV3MS50_9GAMM